MEVGSVSHFKKIVDLNMSLEFQKKRVWNCSFSTWVEWPSSVLQASGCERIVLILGWISMHDFYVAVELVSVSAQFSHLVQLRPNISPNGL